MTISTRKAKRIRLGITAARSRKRPSMYGSWTAFGEAYDRENATLNLMFAIIPPELHEEYLGLIMSGMFGFANEPTKSRIIEIENALRRLATSMLREDGTR